MEWFKHDLNTRNSDQIWELISAHGAQGYGLWWVLLEECYSLEEEGFQINATETWFKRLSKDLELTDWRTLIRFLDTTASLGLIDAQLWADQVVHIPGIQKRADEYVKKKAKNAERQAAYKARLKEEESRVSNALPVTGKEESRVSNDHLPEITPSEIRDQIQRSDSKSDPESKTNPEKKPIRLDPISVRAMCRKGGFQSFWDDYRKKCTIFGGHSPGRKPEAERAWAERFGAGEPDQLFADSFEAFWDEKQRCFSRNQHSPTPPTFENYLRNPESYEQLAIARQQLLAQAPQMANPKTVAAAVDEEAKAQAKAARIARMQAKLAQEAS